MHKSFKKSGGKPHSGQSSQLLFNVMPTLRAWVELRRTSVELDQALIAALGFHALCDHTAGNLLVVVIRHVDEVLVQPGAL